MWEGPPAVPPPLKEGSCTPRRDVAGGGAVPTASCCHRRRGHAPRVAQLPEGDAPQALEMERERKRGRRRGKPEWRGRGRTEWRDRERRTWSRSREGQKGEAARWEMEACGETERVREESRNPKGSIFKLEYIIGPRLGLFGRWDINRG